MTRDWVTDFMEANGIERTRARYLVLAFCGDPVELDAEMEMELPPDLRDRPRRKARKISYQK